MQPEFPPQLNWKPHSKTREDVYDGDIYLVAVEVHNNKTNKVHWEIEKIRIACDWDGEDGFFDLIYADCADSTSYDAWCWEDFDYVIKLGEY